MTFVTDVEFSHNPEAVLHLRYMRDMNPKLLVMNVDMNQNVELPSVIVNYISL